MLSHFARKKNRLTILINIRVNKKSELIHTFTHGDDWWCIYRFILLFYLVLFLIAFKLSSLSILPKYILKMYKMMVKLREKLEWNPIFFCFSRQKKTIQIIQNWNLNRENENVQGCWKNETLRSIDFCWVHNQMKEFFSCCVIEKQKHQQSNQDSYQKFIYFQHIHPPHFYLLQFVYMKV